MAKTTRMTAAEYIALPNDERRCELINGVVVVNEPRLDHGCLKLAHYQAAGLPELWLVDTVAESVIVLRRSTPESPEFDDGPELRGDELLTSPQLPGFALRVADIFRDIP